MTDIDRIRSAADRALFDARTKGVVTPHPSWSDMRTLLAALDLCNARIKRLEGAIREHLHDAEDNIGEYRHALLSVLHDPPGNPNRCPHGVWKADRCYSCEPA